MGIVEIAVRRRRLSDSKDSSGLHAEIPMKNKFFIHDQAITVFRWNIDHLVGKIRNENSA